jgi:BirA family biotin operon repressor/biotin-[acetyl-CoA-carboxylase] ligase
MDKTMLLSPRGEGKGEGEISQIMNPTSDTRVFGKRVYSYPKVKSTNDIAYTLAEQGAEEGTVVIAIEQTKGKGRVDHYWFSPPGGLWLSLILRPLMVSSFISQLSLLGALGITTSIKRMFPLLSSGIRWPNDAVINGKKVGGVLCRAKNEQKKVVFVIMGIGVNVNIEEFPSPLCFTATSLKRETGCYVPEETFQRCLLEELERLYFSFLDDSSALLEEIRLFSSLLGKQIKVKISQEELTGLVQDIDEKGRLILRLESGIQRRIGPEEGHISG